MTNDLIGKRERFHVWRKREDNDLVVIENSEPVAAFTRAFEARFAQALLRVKKRLALRRYRSPPT